mmetsp:Transcript_7942/g.20766  ORF Transcript_7942/g.20766 Transcript_7942/m.20766 type:complete len:386 (+) Transcript_7942:115-1272(+)|eukprot:CAMPEP_0115860008 /NCGR_PEP_ID=MMETSP0287-20121206/16906_1 /TAXON_ID=412157 /ORGANISM="Chrysochromulina rotalis, Strain UIO044" /LENGTH=385 /DNA_ID=CAMNT_0003314319 /DNA_START=30 /DNA_END=1187 /DNA_ORIENTATION=-
MSAFSIERGLRGRKRPLTINHDLYHAVNPLIVGDESSMVDITSLNMELRCPICLRLMRDPMATECLHRFCKDCIEKCQRQAQKQCPSCRKPIATRRSLRPDPNIKLLIKKLYPDLEAFEADEEEEMAENSRRMAETHLLNIEKQLERQRALAASMLLHNPPPNRVEYEARSTGRSAAGQSRTGGVTSTHVDEGDDDAGDDDDDDEYDEGEEDGDEDGEDESDDDEAYESDASYRNETLEYETWAFEGKGKHRASASGARGGTGSTSGRVHRKAPPNPNQSSDKPLQPRSFEFGFRLRPHPEEEVLPRLLRDYVVVSCLATVEHIHKFLLIQLTGREASDFELQVVLLDGSKKPLPPTMTLNEMVQTFNLDASSLDIIYRGAAAEA